VILPFVANCQQQWRWKRYRQPSDGQLLLGQPNEFWNDHDPVQADWERRFNVGYSSISVDGNVPQFNVLRYKYQQPEANLSIDIRT
jgi:hypothetical protein